MKLLENKLRDGCAGEPIKLESISEIAALLKKLGAHLDIPGASAENAACHMTAQVLAGWARAFPEPPYPPDVEYALERLCRKVDVAKRVAAVYDGDWKKPLDRTPLALEAWPVLILFFLLHGAQLSSGDGDVYGKSLKSINAAFNAINLFVALGGGEHQATLAAAADKVLREVLAK
jgi:hypothetical protein